MKRNLALIAVLMLSLLVAGNAFAGAPVDRATGGGQILVGDGGAGTTIAFNARGTFDDAEGQVQYIIRQVGGNGKGTGQGQVVQHGVVNCLEANGNMAEIKGEWTKGATGPFQMFVTDVGEGQTDDTILVENVDEPDACNDEEEGDPSGQVALARGNTQVYDAD